MCVEVDSLCFRRWEKHSAGGKAEGKAEQNSFVLASFTQSTVLQLFVQKKIHVFCCNMYLLQLKVPIVIVLQE